MSVLYNEHDPFAVTWLRKLVAARHILRGAVDARDIQQLTAADLTGIRQFHAFAGIGGWSYALRLAGWPDDRPCWTVSCPCQPFSAAGKRAGFEDERHLWPVVAGLVRECRPPVVFGEQVASPAGRAWLDVVCADLEGAGYAVGAAVLPAAGVGAPHGRHRVYFVAGRVADADGREPGDRPIQRGGHDGLYATHGSAAGGALCGGGSAWVASGGALDPWADCEWLPCRDGKYRPTQPGLFPLAHGIPGRVGRLRASLADEETTLIRPSRSGMLRAYGNAIVPQAAAVFIRAFLGATEDVQYVSHREGGG